MDIITHTLSGVAVGSVLINCSNKNTAYKGGILFCGALGAALPDIDALSMWSGFDSSFGRWFNLSYTGKEIYSAKLWYSHHAFFHSLLAAALFTVLLAALFFVVKKYLSPSRDDTFIRLIKERRSLLLVFFAGYVIHLFEDMLTPASSWGGVAFLWPSGRYTGGWGHIWWWNNYDVFLIVCGVIAFNFTLSFLRVKHQLSQYAAVLIFVAGVLFSGIRIADRGLNYNYTKTRRYQQLEKISLEEQKEILGEDLFHIMRKIDRLLPVYF